MSCIFKVFITRKVHKKYPFDRALFRIKNLLICELISMLIKHLNRWTNKQCGKTRRTLGKQLLKTNRPARDEIETGESPARPPQGWDGCDWAARD